MLKHFLFKKERLPFIFIQKETHLKPAFNRFWLAEKYLSADAHPVPAACLQSHVDSTLPHLLLIRAHTYTHKCQSPHSELHTPLCLFRQKHCNRMRNCLKDVDLCACLWVMFVTQQKAHLGKASWVTLYNTIHLP